MFLYVHIPASQDVAVELSIVPDDLAGPSNSILQELGEGYGTHVACVEESDGLRVEVGSRLLIPYVPTPQLNRR